MSEKRYRSSFYRDVIDEMQGTEFDVLWKHDEHPTDASLNDAVDHGQMFLGIAGGGDDIACAAVVNHDQVEGYDAVPWEVQGPLDRIGIVHSVATRAKYHGRGFAKKLMEGIARMAADDGLLALRLDTFTHNKRSHGFYEKTGFVSRGIWPLYYDDLGTVDLLMYERVL